MVDIGGGIGLPTMSQRRCSSNFLETTSLGVILNLEIAAAIGEQMIHGLETFTTFYPKKDSRHSGPNSG